MIIAAAGCVITALCGYYYFKALFLCIGLGLSLAVIFLFKRKTHCFIVVLLILLTAVSGVFNFCKIRKITAAAKEPVTVQVCALATTYKGGTVYKTDVEVLECDRLPKGTKLSLWHNPMYLNAGDIYSCQIKLSRIDGAYKELNFSNGIYLSGEIQKCKKLNRQDKVLSGVQSIRDYIKETLFQNMSYDSAATVCALVFGEKGYFSDRFYNAVKASGVAHIMVVSGMHLSITVSLLLKFTEKRMHNPLLRATVIFLAVLAVCSVCGFTKSILRAGVTYVIMGTAMLINRQYSGENALAGAVVMLLINSPLIILNVGFQLSVLATFGILAVALPICEYIKEKFNSKITVWALQTVTVSLAASLLTLPVIIKVYGYVSTVAVITNLLITIPVTLCLSVSVATLILNLLFPFAASVVLHITDLVVRYINSVILFFGELPFSTCRTPEYMIFAALGLIFAVFFIMLACKRRQDMLKLKAINGKISREGRAGRWRLSRKKN